MLATDRVHLLDKWSRNYFPFSMEGVVFYLPFWQEDMQGTPLISYDQYHHSCGVTGATKNATGFLFDGTDDSINCGSATDLDNIFDGGGTVIAWINPNSDGESSNGIIAAKRKPTTTTGWSIHLLGESAGSSWFGLYYHFSTTAGYWRSTDLVIPNLSLTQVAVTYNSDDVANVPIFCVNGSAVAITVAGTPVGVRVSDADLNLLIGDNSDSLSCFDGTIIEEVGYKRILSPAEIAYYYNNSYPRRWQ